MVHDTIFKLERHAFLSGYYKAFGFGAYPFSAKHVFPKRVMSISIL
ncbi:MAG: hypothetical protein U9Q37_02555 [Euryarchaeota archaeon]|nr:hypothetical protein [Euryarchaeota archaeon]